MKPEKKYKLSEVTCTLLNPPTWRRKIRNGTGSALVGNNCSSKWLVDCVSTCNPAPTDGKLN